VLKQGGSAIDAVEVGIRMVEDNAEDHSVGLGGYPNLLGEVELDAGIMDGRSLAAGGVGAMRACQNPISVARQVMERLPHVFLVGPGAERFAAEMGFEACDLGTEEALKTWRERLLVDMTAEQVAHLAERPDLWRWVEIATDPQRTKGTVNFIAQDGAGDICAGVSTSGWAWKYPGRVGDSPIVGAGLYADNRYGAATCTGMGEMAIRAGTARSFVLYLKMGMSLSEAGRQAMQDLDDLGGRYLGGMSFIALDASGRHAGFSNGDGGRYLAMTSDMEQPEEIERTYVPTRTRWGGQDPDSSR
jgi:beta-aspartyl-peptidase (threonine type)